TVRDLRLPCFLDRAEHRHGFARGHADPRDEPLQRHRRHRRSRVRAGGREEPGDLRSGRRDRQRGQPRIFRGEQPAPELMRLASGKKKPGIAGFLFLVALGAATRNYIGWTWSACKPFWPCTTTKETCWPSFRLLKPCDWIARKCTNTSSPFSRLMKPKPLASLNHLTVPVSRFDIFTCSLERLLVVTRLASCAGSQGGSEVQRCSGSMDQPHRATVHGDPGKHSARTVPRDR